MSELSLDHVRFTDGLIAAVAQDRSTGEVLMVAHLDGEALRRTLRTGEAWYRSRSRHGLWRKGETSGHVQRVQELRLDCDGDAVLLVVEQTGPACHTGHRSCFFRDLHGAERPGPPSVDVLDEVFVVIQDRAARQPESSYTAGLIRAGREAVAAKVREESAELIQAADAESDRRVVEEAADLLYHMMVLLASRGVSLDEVRRELRRRRDGR